MRNIKSADKSEFDTYAATYTEGVDRPLKRFLGKSSSSFIEVKAKYLLDHLWRQAGKPGWRSGSTRLLDFGCGTGELLWFMDQYGFPGRLEGCDVSQGMLSEATRRWTDKTAPPLHETRDNRLPFDNETFNLVVASCVFHHIRPEMRAGVVAEIARVLKYDGHFVVFEHNPYNPLTRWMVSHSPFDENAELLIAAETLTLMKKSNFAPLRKDYILFFPPRFSQLWRLEAYLRPLPFGGQYAAIGSKKR